MWTGILVVRQFLCLKRIKNGVDVGLGLADQVLVYKVLL